MNRPTYSVMTDKVHTVLWSESLRSAYEKMHRYQVRHLPVIDDDGQVTGMLSDRDLQRAMIVDSPDQAARDVRAEFDPNQCVGDFMASDVFAISINSDLLEAAQTMKSLKISALVVADDKGEMVGIITSEDLLQVLIELLNHKSSVFEEFKSLCYNSSLGPIANFLSQSGI